MTYELKENETIMQQALTLVKDIAEEDLIDDFYSDGICKCCIIGHWSRLNSKNKKDYSLNNCSDFIAMFEDDKETSNIKRELRNKSLLYFENVKNKCYDISDVNNGICEFYKQETIKERIVAFLNDAIEAGY